jgi:hypothetical protein
LLFWQCFLSHTFLLPSFSVLTYQHRLVAWTVVAFVLSREHDSRHVDMFFKRLIIYTALTFKYFVYNSQVFSLKTEKLLDWTTGTFRWWVWYITFIFIYILIQGRSRSSGRSTQHKWTILQRRICRAGVLATFVVGSDTDVMTVYVLDSRW